MAQSAESGARDGVGRDGVRRLSQEAGVIVEGPLGDRSRAAPSVLSINHYGRGGPDLAPRRRLFREGLAEGMRLLDRLGGTGP
jgi:hypothetical protein